MKEIDFSSLLKILLRDYSLSISEFASSVHSSEEEINACLNGSKPSHHLLHHIEEAYAIPQELLERYEREE